MVTCEHVIGLAREGRVAKAPNFHGRSAHGSRFETLAQALLFTFRVERDRRLDHPHGWVAFTQNWGGEVYRVDFDLANDAGGDLILIVTGWQLE